MKTYIAIDPGVGTGVGSFYPSTGVFHSEEMFDLQDVASWVRSFGRTDHVVRITEKFIISSRTVKTKVYYESLYFNGWLSIEYAGRIEQTAAQAKGYADDAMLHHFGWYLKTKDGHANDAARHLLYRMSKDRVPWMLDRLKGYL